METREYRYGLVARPASPGAVPTPFLRVEPRKETEPESFRHGVAVYDRKLSPVETYDFELVFVLETDEDYDEVTRLLLDGGVIKPEWTSRPEQLQKFLDSARIRKMIGHGEIARLTSAIERACAQGAE